MAKSQIEKAERVVGAIDKRIDAVRAELLRHETLDEMSYAGWHGAWEKHPVLRSIERSLFDRRGDAQDTLAGLIAKQERITKAREQREFMKRVKAARNACPACGSVVFAVAA